MKVYQTPDVAAAAADVAATLALVTLAWTTGVFWWWFIAAGWTYVTYRQVRVAHRTSRSH